MYLLVLALLLGVLGIVLILMNRSEGYATTTSLSYDVSTSLDAHAYAFQKTCEDAGLRFVPDPVTPYCVIDNKARCDQRNKELETTTVDVDKGKVAYWLPNVGPYGSGVCVEVPGGVKGICDEFGMSTITFTPGAVTCDFEKGVCMPKGWDPATMSASSDAKLADGVVKNLATCVLSRGSGMCPGMTLIDSTTNDDGVVLGDCWSSNAQQFGEMLLGSSTIYRRLKDSGEKMAAECGKDPVGKACWNSMGNVFYSGLADPAFKVTKAYAAHALGTFKDSLMAFANNPTSDANMQRLYMSVMSITPSGQLSLMMGHMIDGLTTSMSSKIPPGFVTWLMVSSSNIEIAVMIQLMGVASRGAKVFANFLAQKGVGDWLSKVFGLPTGTKQVTMPWDGQTWNVTPQ